MALRQYDIVKRIAYPPNPGGYYYWSTTLYYDTADFGSAAQALNRALNVDRIHTIDQAQYMKVVVKEPPGRGNVIQTVTPFSTFGMIASTTEPFSLINVMRLQMFYDDDRHSYRYMRMPILDIWTAGESLTPYLLARAASYINNQKAVSGFPAARNQYGGSCTAGLSPTKLSMWQLRHGTLRRERAY